MHKKPDPLGKKVKIALVCDDSLDRPDGVQQFVVTLGEWLRAEGHDVHYITSTTTRHDLKNVHVVAKNVEVKFNANRLRPPLPASPRAVRELLRREAFDIIHVQMPYSPLLAGQVIQFAPKTATIVGTFHILPESALVERASRVLGFALAPQLKRFASFSSTSAPTRVFMKQTYKVDSTVIPNMTDISKFAVRPPARKKAVQIVFLGRLVERKGAGYLLRAVNQMRRSGVPEHPFAVRIGGKGVLRDELEAYVAEHSLQDIVTFDGFVAEEEKAAYLAAADIAVFPSTGGESFGISLIEAMAATPGVIIAGNNPGYASVIGDHTAQLVDPIDTDTFAHTLARFVDKPADRAVARAWQKHEVLGYDVAPVGNRFLAFYADALHKRSQ